MKNNISYILVLYLVGMVQIAKSLPDDHQAADTTGQAEYGSSVDLKAPSEKTTSKYAKIIGWKGNTTPQAAHGFKVVKFAGELNSPRNIYVAQNGDVYVAQSRTEKKGEDLKKVDSRNRYRSESPNDIVRFRDTDNDGIADSKEVFLSGLSQPYGMLILGGYFYVANTDGVVRFRMDTETQEVKGKGEKIISLPAGGYNNHWTRNLIASADEKKIYISVGSGSNVGENGMENEVRRAAILEINPDGTGERIYASGIRNPVGMDWEPAQGKLWTAVNERDQLGDELVPDYITAVQDNGFYGWPFSYWGNHIDPRWQNRLPVDRVENVVKPDYAVGAHTASLGIAFSKLRGFGQGAFVSQHGSWNRSNFSGYKVIFIPFSNGKPAAKPQDFLTGFIADETTAEVHGRPVDVAFTDHYMLVSDDAANIIWAILPD